MDDKQRIEQLHGDFAKRYAESVTNNLCTACGQYERDFRTAINVFFGDITLCDVIKQAVLDGALAERVRYARIVEEAAR